MALKIRTTNVNLTDAGTGNASKKQPTNNNTSSKPNTTSNTNSTNSSNTNLNKDSQSGTLKKIRTENVNLTDTGTGNSPKNNSTTTSNNGRNPNEDSKIAEVKRKRKLAFQKLINETEAKIEQLEKDLADYKTMLVNIDNANINLTYAKNNVSNANSQFSASYFGTVKSAVISQIESEYGRICVCMSSLNNITQKVNAKIQKIEKELENKKAQLAQYNKSLTLYT